MRQAPRARAWGQAHEQERLVLLRGQLRHPLGHRGAARVLQQHVQNVGRVQCRRSRDRQRRWDGTRVRRQR